MSRSLTAADRSALIRLASTFPAESDERRAILAGLKIAMQRRIPWSYPTGMERYADKLNTRVHGVRALRKYLATGSWPDGQPPMLSLGRHIAFKDELERVLPPGMFRRVRF